jgi:peroxiredoxin Q/BCP
VEATEFRDRIPEFQKLGVAVYGLSADDLESHNKFSEKHQLNFPLLADLDHQWIDQAGLRGEQEWNGKKFIGIFRTTLVVGPDGRLEHLWEKVKFQNHAEEVLTTLQQ